MSKKSRRVKPVYQPGHRLKALEVRTVGWFKKMQEAMYVCECGARAVCDTAEEARQAHIAHGKF